MSLGCTTAATRPRRRGDRRPNVLFIAADDMNYDAPGVTGNRMPGVTPHIDALAAEGVRFVHAHVTAAVCQPSRQSLMTGRYPHNNGAPGFDPIAEDVPTLQEQLAAAGYLNGILGKVGHLAPQHKFCWHTSLDAGDLGRGRDPRRYYEEAKAFLERARAAGRPFFLMANSHDPHRPFAGSEDERRKFGEHAPVRRTFAPEEVVVPGFLPDLPDVRREVAQYYTSCYRCDETVGEVLRALRETGFDEDTLVMFLSDNGMAFPFAKTNCYLASTRTPWIVRWPGQVAAGTVDDTHFLVGHDFMPTILEAVGLDRVPGLDGRSFLPVIRGERDPSRTSAFTVFNVTSARQEYPMRAIQERRLGYLFNAWSDGELIFRNESQAGLTMAAMRTAAETDPAVAARVRMFLYRVPEELYDFEHDPHALHNLIDDPLQRAERDRLRRALYEAMTATRDPLAPVFAERVLAT